MSFLDDRAGLSGRVAAVIGGGSGIGAAVSLALARAGVDVALLDINASAVPATVQQVLATGQLAIGTVGDACDVSTLESFYRGVEASFGRLDILVNVAGGTVQKKFMDMDRADFERDIRRNYAYALDSIRLAVPLIRKGGRGGSIVNFTTIEAHRGAAGFSVYAGAKAALTNFTRALAVELGGEGIRVNTLVPDTTPSEGNANAIPEPLRSKMAAVPMPAMMQNMGMYIPLKAPPMPENLADGVLFLVSDLAKFVTGTALHVDGGTMAAAGFLEWPYGEGHLPVAAPTAAIKLFGDDPS